MNSMTKNKQRQNLIDGMVKSTRFPDRSAIENVLKIYKECVPKGCKFDRPTLREFLGSRFHMTDEMLMDRIFKVFDKDSDGKLSETEFVQGMSLFFYGTDEERAKFAFEVYDLNSDSSLVREEMYVLLKNSLPAKQLDEDPEEGVKDLVDQTLKIYDKEQDPKLSKEEYSAAGQKNWLTIELYGPCLPDEESSREFLESVCVSKGGRSGKD